MLPSEHKSPSRLSEPTPAGAGQHDGPGPSGPPPGLRGPGEWRQDPDEPNVWSWWNGHGFTVGARWLDGRWDYLDDPGRPSSTPPLDALAVLALAIEFTLYGLPLGFVLGIVALYRIRHSPTPKRGKACAIAAIVLPLVCFVVASVLLGLALSRFPYPE
jgi:hypothetical protein